ncbi:hypothetical protein AB6E79_25130 [Vibrio lentus]
MRLTKKKGILLLFLGGISYWYYQDAQPDIWGDEADEPYITVSGEKPKNSHVDAWLGWGESGEKCKTRTFSFGNGWSDGADVDWHITHDFSSDPNKYELRIPYKQYHNDSDCDVSLGDIIIQAYNPFDTVGFAQLRIYQAGNDYYNKPIPLDSKIEARDCNGHLYKWAKDMWKGIIGCNYLVDGSKLSEGSETNAETVYFDFSEFNDDTVIHYDISAGDDYRSTPLEPKAGE